MEKVFYVPGQPWVLDFAIEADGVARSELTGRTLEQVQAENPGAILCTYDEARAQIEALCKSEPKPISAADFEYALEVLPPRGWVADEAGESFKMAEHLNGRITGIYARIGETFWRFDDVFTMTHAEIMARVRPCYEKTKAA